MKTEIISLEETKTAELEKQKNEFHEEIEILETRKNNLEKEVEQNKLNLEKSLSKTREDIEYYNDLGKLILIAHESLHLYEGLKMQDGDQTHDLWLSNFSKMQEIVKEYSDDNNLGLNEDEIFELSIYNIGPGGTQFDDYVNKMATKYKTSYQEELESYYIRMDLLIDDEYKKSFYFENEIKQNPTDEDK